MRGGNSHDRRRRRRAANRSDVPGPQRALSAAAVAELDAGDVNEHLTVEARNRILELVDQPKEPCSCGCPGDQYDGHACEDFATTERLALIETGEALGLRFDADVDTAEAGECDCGHPAEMHAGADNTGSCTEDGCSCGAYGESDGGYAVIPITADGAMEAPRFVVSPGTPLTDEGMERFRLHIEDFKFDAEAAIPATDPLTGESRWQAVIVPEGTLTDDGRAFAPGAVTWRELPLTLCAMLDSPHADVVTKAEACGRIDRIWREGNLVLAEGVFDTGEYGQKIAGMVHAKTLRGISVDVAVHESEMRPRSDFFDEDGTWRDVPLESDEVDLMDVLFDENAPPPIFVVTAGTIGSVTVCPFAAFADAKIEVAASLVAAVQAPMVWTMTSPLALFVGTTTQLEVTPALRFERPAPIPELTAAVALNALETPAEGAPPAEWFNNPELDGPTPLTVDDDGRIFGHAADWTTCHVAYTDICQLAPRSVADYRYFHLKEVVTADGERIAVGTITLDTGHAGRGMNAETATAHYDDTGVAVADVRVGEDEHGIWVAGAVRSDVPHSKVRALRGASLSGDWRQVQLATGEKNLELVALLAVNVPGFPVPRTRALIAAADGQMEVLALTAAGVLGDPERARLNQVAVLGQVARGDFAALARRAREA